MAYPPGHFQQATRRHRSRRERLSIRLAALVALALTAVVAYSLASHQATSGNGCVDFDYATMIGGAEMHRCGTEARALCTTRAGGRSLDTDFQAQLEAACRRAGIAAGRARR